MDKLAALYYYLFKNISSPVKHIYINNLIITIMEFKLKAPIAKLGKDEKRIQLSLFKTENKQTKKSVKVRKAKRAKRIQRKRK